MTFQRPALQRHTSSDANKWNGNSNWGALKALTNENLPVSTMCLLQITSIEADDSIVTSRASSNVLFCYFFCPEFRLSYYAPAEERTPERRTSTRFLISK